jgi:hypothetical protein
MRWVSRATGLIGEPILPRKRENAMWIKGMGRRVMGLLYPVDGALAPPGSARAPWAQLRYLPHPGGGVKGQ